MDTPEGSRCAGLSNRLEVHGIAITDQAFSCCEVRGLKTLAGACRARAKWRSLQCVPTHASPNAYRLPDAWDQAEAKRTAHTLSQVFVKLVKRMRRSISSGFHSRRHIRLIIQVAMKMPGKSGTVVRFGRNVMAKAFGAILSFTTTICCRIRNLRILDWNRFISVDVCGFCI